MVERYVICAVVSVSDACCVVEIFFGIVSCMPSQNGHNIVDQPPIGTLVYIWGHVIVYRVI